MRLPCGVIWYIWVWQFSPHLQPNPNSGLLLRELLLVLDHKKALTGSEFSTCSRCETIPEDSYWHTRSNNFLISASIFPQLQSDYSESLAAADPKFSYFTLILVVYNTPNFVLQASLPGSGEFTTLASNLPVIGLQIPNRFLRQRSLVSFSRRFLG